MSAPSFTVQYGAATHRGLVRAGNEDSYLTVPPIFLVADGMGGHLRGEVASAEAVRQFGVLAGRPWVAAEDLHERLVAAASGVEALAGSGPAPGTTLAGVALTHESGRPYWLAFNLGDSRVYLLRQGLLEQISVDHSRHQELLEAGADPGSLNVGRHIITRALGAGGPATPEWDLWLRPAQRGDRILICSDGLSTELTDLLIAATLRSAPEPQQAAQADRTQLVPDPALVAATRVARALLDDGTPIPLTPPSVLGRNPRPPGSHPDATPLVLDDQLASKTHLLLGSDEQGPWVIDLHSTNGVLVRRAAADVPGRIQPGRKVRLAPGVTVPVGARTIEVR